ncbi:MAG: murein hydrolase activator NlpD [Sodalis sp. (in: enterobacteria)]
MSMGSPKCAWRRVAICAMASMWLAGCANNETSAAISSVSGSKSSRGYSDNALTSASTHRPARPLVVAAVSSKPQGKVNLARKGNILYNRSYDSIHKGSYSSALYQVKRGDTLFHIAWITGNDYRDLAQRNNIRKPYNLNVGQTLQVGNGTRPIAGNAQARIILESNSNKANTGVVAASVPALNAQLRESSAFSNKKSSYSDRVSKQSVGNMFTSINNNMSPITSTVVTRASPVSAFSKAITGWCWPTDGKIIDNFSDTEGGNKGVDISGSLGQPILATANGRVVYAGNALQGYGNLIIIKHNDNYLSAYAHNDTMLVPEQQKVRAGQKIATMGSSGTSTTRLHFEIRYKGKSVNPLRYLPQR